MQKQLEHNLYKEVGWNLDQQRLGASVSFQQNKMTFL